MSEVIVVSRKWDGGPHRRMTAVELGSDRAGTWLWVREGAHVETATGSYASPAALRLLHPGRAWSAYFVPAGTHSTELRQIYVDVTSPTVRTADTFEFVDLDLDIEQLDGGPARVLDRDELARHARQMGYPAEVVQEAESVCREVLVAVRSRTTPFDDSYVTWLARARSAFDR